MKKTEILKYVVVLIVTVGLFATIFYATDLVNSKRVSAVRIAQDTIAINLLSSETQFTLLRKTDCSAGVEENLFKNDLKSVADRLAYLESTVGPADDEVLNLKKYYSLLELKDYLLIDELGQRCGFKPATVIYFNNATCTSECQKQDYVIAGLREKYPELRVYTFDTSLDLSAVKTLQNVTRAGDVAPTVIAGGKVLKGFQPIEDLEKALAPQLKKSQAAKKATQSATASE